MPVAGTIAGVGVGAPLGGTVVTVNGGSDAGTDETGEIPVGVPMGAPMGIPEGDAVGLVVIMETLAVEMEHWVASKSVQIGVKLS